MVIVIKEGKVDLIEIQNENLDICNWLKEKNGLNVNLEYLSYRFGRYNIETLQYNYWEVLHWVLSSIILYSLINYLTGEKDTIIMYPFVLVKSLYRILQNLTDDRLLEQLNKNNVLKDRRYLQSEVEILQREVDIHNMVRKEMRDYHKCAPNLITRAPIKVNKQ